MRILSLPRRPNYLSSFPSNHLLTCPPTLPTLFHSTLHSLLYTLHHQNTSCLFDHTFNSLPLLLNSAPLHSTCPNRTFTPSPHHTRPAAPTLTPSPTHTAFSHPSHSDRERSRHMHMHLRTAGRSSPSSPVAACAAGSRCIARTPSSRAARSDSPGTAVLRRIPP